jgi:hypothetical protein
VVSGDRDTERAFQFGLERPFDRSPAIASHLTVRRCKQRGYDADTARLAIAKPLASVDTPELAFHCHTVRVARVRIGQRRDAAARG